jgi:hypothetical protein
MVHDRSQPVQPRRSPHRAEVFPVFPTVPPQTQESPAAALGALRTILRTPIGAGLGMGRFSWRTTMKPAAARPTTTTMTVAAK